MSEGADSQAPASRSRPAGGRRGQQPASAMEDSGVRRSTRSRSSVTPTPPESNVKQHPKNLDVGAGESGPSGAGAMKRSAHRGKADHAGGGWAVQGPRESLSTYASRVQSHLCEYEEATKTIRRLREELRCARARANTAQKKRKTEIYCEINKLKADIDKLMKRKNFICNNSGPFKEKLLNDERFSEMADTREQRLKGLQPASQVEEEDDDDDNEQQFPPGGLQEDQQASCSAPPAGQPAVTPRSGEDSDTGSQGGALMAEIRLLESPVRMENFSFGDELPEEATGGSSRRKSKKTRPKQQEEVRFIFTPLPVHPPGQSAGSAHCASPATQTPPSSAVDPVQRCREITKPGGEVQGSISACSSGNGAGKASAERPDTECRPAGGAPSSTGTVACSPGGGGGSLVSASVTGPSPSPPSGGDFSMEKKVLFCIGTGNTENRHPVETGERRTAAKRKLTSDAEEAEGKSQSGVGVTSGQTMQAGGIGSVEVASAPMARDAEAVLPSVVTAGPASVNGAVAEGSLSGVENAGDGGAVSRDGGMERGIAGTSGAAMVGGDVVTMSGSVAVDEGAVVSGGAAVSGDGGMERGIAGTSGAAMVGGVAVTGEVPVSRDTGVAGGVAGTCGDAMVGGDGVAGCFAGNKRAVMSGGMVGSGPVVPPAVATPSGGRSYASVTAGGDFASSSSSGPRGNILQQRLLEALRKGERSITVEGGEVDLSFWIERHGLGAFRENRGGETAWSLPTAGPGGARRNVVRLRWRGSDACPPRTKVVELLLEMGFKAIDIFALIHPYGTSEFDVSFVRPEGLELFWGNYELKKNMPGWRDFVVQAVSRQNQVKKVTILTRNESLSCYDIMTWLGRYGEVLETPRKNRDEFGIWSGAWTFMMKLKVSGNSVAHIPSSAFLGRDRIQIFYQGQPKLCHRCGDPTHFSANCTVQKCALCGGVGHLAASCKQIRCHLCGDLGHPFSRCPRSFANAVLAPVGEGHEAESAGEGTSRGGGTEGPGKKDKKVTPSRQRRQERRQRDREVGESRVTAPGPVLQPNLVAEAPRNDELDEEVRRIQREEAATLSESSHYESMDEDSRAWLQEKRKQGKRKKKKKGDLQSSLTLTQKPKEGKTDSPLVGLSNRFQALDNVSASEVEGEVPERAGGLSGDAESSAGDASSSEWETDLESGDEDERADMDTTVSKKRGKGSSSETDEKSGGKKKAV